MTLFFISINAVSQNMPYQELDSLSNRISELQFAANGITYREAGDDYKLSFPKENFKVFTANRMAMNAVYKKETGKPEILELTENIDLTKITSFKGHFGNDEMVCFRMVFPEGSITTKVYENGQLTKTITNNYIDFYSNLNKSKTNSNYNTWQLFNSLVYLAHSLKAEKKLFNYNIDELDKKWKQTVDVYKVSEIKEFIAKNKGTLYVAQGERMLEGIANWDKQRKNKREWLLNFADSLSAKYKFKPDMFYYLYKDFNPAVAKVKLKYYNNGNYWGYPATSYTRKNLSFDNISEDYFVGYLADANDKIINLSYYFHSEKGRNGSAKKIITDIYELVRKNTDPYFVKFEEKENGDRMHVVIKVPVSAEDTTIKYYISYTYFFYADVAAVSIHFSTKENLANSY